MTNTEALRKSRIIIRDLRKKNRDLNKEIGPLRRKNTNLNKKLFTKEVKYLEMIDKLKKERDDAHYRLEMCAQGKNMLDIINIYDE